MYTIYTRRRVSPLVTYRHKVSYKKKLISEMIHIKRQQLPLNKVIRICQTLINLSYIDRLS